MMNLTDLTSPRLAFSPAMTGLTAAVGNTPLFPLRNITAGLPPAVQVLVKAEWFNPGGSVKDRAALNIIRTALSREDLTPRKRLLDSTSGNTGIAYATFGAALGIGVTLVVPAGLSRERHAILEALGAELVFVDDRESGESPVERAFRMAEEQPERYFYANQYDNPANWLAHYHTTGPEIIQQTGGAVTHLVAGMGTAGTLMGTSRALKHFNPQVQAVAVQPDDAAHGLEGIKHMATSPHPAIYDPALPDRVVEVATEEVHRMVRRLAREEGLFVGVSAGAAVVAALRVAAALPQGLIVAILPDAGYKYLSNTALWAGI